MAVAVKNPPVSAASNPYDRMPVVSLVGAAYVVVCLVIVFGVLPYLWRTGTGFTGIGGDVVLGLIMLAAFTALAVVGARLIGPKQPAGARAGIFAAIVALRRGAAAHPLGESVAGIWGFRHHLFGDSAATTGLILTGVILLGLARRRSTCSSGPKPRNI